jgi:hypothetical protein
VLINTEGTSRRFHKAQRGLSTCKLRILRDGGKRRSEVRKLGRKEKGTKDGNTKN